jgi:anaerobic selenocysteine-containing dehydrogenase
MAELAAEQDLRFHKVCSLDDLWAGEMQMFEVSGVEVSVVGDPDNPVNYGKLCSKAGNASVEQLYHRDRINYPLIRTGEKGAGRWNRVTWKEAISHIATSMLAIREEFGAEAVAFARGVSMNNNQIVTRLANVFGTPNYRVDQLLLLWAAGGRVLCDFERALQRSLLGHGRNRGFLQWPELHRRVGIAETHQQ